MSIRGRVQLPRVFPQPPAGDNKEEEENEGEEVEVKPGNFPKKAGIRRGGRRRARKKNVTALLEKEEIVEEKTHFTKMQGHVKTETGEATGSLIFPMTAHVEVDDVSNIHTLLEEKKDEETEGEEGDITDPFILKTTKNTPNRLEFGKKLLNDPHSGFTTLKHDDDRTFIDIAANSTKINHTGSLSIDEIYQIAGSDPSKKGIDYVSPKVDLGKKKRLWETNLMEKAFFDLNHKNHKVKFTLPFAMLNRVDMLPEESTLLLKYRVEKKKKQQEQRLKCDSKETMWRLYEYIRFGMLENPSWCPELLNQEQKDKKTGLRKVKVTGEVDYEFDRGKKTMKTEKKAITNTEFLVGNQFERMTVQCVSWNIGCKKSKLPKTDKAKDFIFKKIIKPGAHIYAVCLQGVSGKMGMMSVYLSGFFKRHFDDKYVIVNGSRCTDVGMYVFIEKKYCRRVGSITWTKKTFPKSFGGSGCICVRFQLNESMVAFMGVNLPENPTHKARIIAEEFSETSALLDDTHVFLMGEFGYVLSIPPEIAIACSMKIRDLLNFDEFLLHREREGLLHQFKEAEIKFPPNVPITGKPGKRCTLVVPKKTRKVTNASYLAYSARILVKSFPGIACRILKYDSIRTLGFACPSAPVYNIIAFDTQRTHVGHFTKMEKKRIIKMTNLVVVQNGSPDFKNAQVIIQGDGLNPSTVISQKVKGTHRTPQFQFNSPLVPVKSCDGFLSSMFLRVTIRDDKELRGAGILNVGKALFEKEGWFTMELCWDTTKICDLIGMMVLEEVKEPEKKK